MPNMLHALFRPGVSSAGTIAQPVQDSDDGNVFRDQSELADQLRYLFRVDVVMVARLVLSDDQFGVRTTHPVQLEPNRRRLGGRVGDYLLEDGSQKALLQGSR